MIMSSLSSAFDGCNNKQESAQPATRRGVNFSWPTTLDWPTPDGMTTYAGKKVGPWGTSKRGAFLSA